MHHIKPRRTLNITNLIEQKYRHVTHFTDYIILAAAKEALFEMYTNAHGFVILVDSRDMTTRIIPCCVTETYATVSYG